MKKKTRYINYNPNQDALESNLYKQTYADQDVDQLTMNWPQYQLICLLTDKYLYLKVYLNSELICMVIWTPEQVNLNWECVECGVRSVSPWSPLISASLSLLHSPVITSLQPAVASPSSSSTITMLYIRQSVCKW